MGEHQSSNHPSVIHRTRSGLSKALTSCAKILVPQDSHEPATHRSTTEPQTSKPPDPPPPYSAESPPPPTSKPTPTPQNDNTKPLLAITPSLSVPQRSPLEQLKRYLIEILAFTLNADSGQISRALEGLEPGPHSSSSSKTNNKKGKVFTSTLSYDERENLGRLAHIINHLRDKHKRNQWLLARDCERKAVIMAIIKPLENCYGRIVGFDCGPFIMDMISTYAVHRCDPSKRGQTILEKCLWWDWNMRRRSGHFEVQLVAHGNLIQKVSPNENVRLILGRALADVQESAGIKHLCRKRYYMDYRYSTSRMYDRLAEECDRL